MYEDDFEDEGGNNLLKDLRKQLKALQKERDEALEQAKSLSQQVKQRSIQEVLTSKGANPKLAKFLLADGVEDEAAAESWLAENGELFGFRPQAEPAVDDDDLAAMQQVQQATATGGVRNDKAVLQSQLLDQAQTPEEWMAAAKALKSGGDGFI